MKKLTLKEEQTKSPERATARLACHGRRLVERSYSLQTTKKKKQRKWWRQDSRDTKMVQSKSDRSNSNGGIGNWERFC
nr:hypothetical protein Itr_chr01CG02000 [Ipomoea trifida]